MCDTKQLSANVLPSLALLALAKNVCTQCTQPSGLTRIAINPTRENVMQEDMVTGGIRSSNIIK